MQQIKWTEQEKTNPNCYSEYFGGVAEEIAADAMNKTYLCKLHVE